MEKTLRKLRTELTDRDRRIIDKYSEPGGRVVDSGTIKVEMVEDQEAVGRIDSSLWRF